MQSHSTPCFELKPLPNETSHTTTRQHPTKKRRYLRHVKVARLLVAGGLLEDKVLVRAAGDLHSRPLRDPGAARHGGDAAGHACELYMLHSLCLYIVCSASPNLCNCAGSHLGEKSAAAGRDGVLLMFFFACCGEVCVVVAVTLSEGAP